jgi:putative membrane protein
VRTATHGGAVRTQFTSGTPCHRERADRIPAAAHPDYYAPVVSSEREPDYRMSLAAERTYLAYLRTGLALTAAGVALAGLPNGGAELFRRVVGIVLVLSGAVFFTEARRRWRAVDQAMRRGQPLPSTRVVGGASWILVAVAVAAVVLVLVI